MRIRQKNGIFVKMPFFCNRKAFGRAGLPVGENGFSFSNVMFVLHFAGNRYSFYSKTQYKEKNMLREDIQNAIKEAMKNHETERLSTVRMVLAGVKEKDVDARGKGKECASDADLLSMMQTMIKQRQESAKMYRDGGREELAAKEEAEISVIQGFLPKQMSESEVEEAVRAAIAETGAASMKDMGKVMGALKEKYAGQMDFGAVSGKIKAMLG